LKGILQSLFLDFLTASLMTLQSDEEWKSYLVQTILGISTYAVIGMEIYVSYPAMVTANDPLRIVAAWMLGTFNATCSFTVDCGDI